MFLDSWGVALSFHVSNHLCSSFQTFAVRRVVQLITDKKESWVHVALGKRCRSHLRKTAPGRGWAAEVAIAVVQSHNVCSSLASAHPQFRGTPQISYINIQTQHTFEALDIPLGHKLCIVFLFVVIDPFTVGPGLASGGCLRMLSQVKAET